MASIFSTLSATKELESWNLFPTWPDLSSGLVGLFILVDLPAVAVRTALNGTVSVLDIFLICPGIHRLQQQVTAELHQGEYPAVAAMTTGYVFRVENPATVFYLQRISKTAHLTTLLVKSAQDQDAAIPSRSPTSADFIHQFVRAVCHCLPLVALMSTVTLTSLIAHDTVFFLTLTLLIISRYLHVYVLRRRTARPVWSGASEPGVHGDLLVLLSQDRWVRMRGLVDDLKAVTSGTWLRPATVTDDVVSTIATLTVYAAVVVAADIATPTGRVGLVALLLLNLASVALANYLAKDLRMFGRWVVPVESGPRAYRRRLDMAEELIAEVKRDDWAVKLGMIGADRVKYSKTKEDEEVVM